MVYVLVETIGEPYSPLVKVFGVKQVSSFLVQLAYYILFAYIFLLITNIRKFCFYSAKLKSDI